jgi:hypothetical protein
MFDIIDSNLSVFRYHYQGEDNLNVMDDEYDESLLFQVPQNIDSFYFADRQLDSIKCIWGGFNSFGWPGFHRADSGYVKGVKINDSTWNVTTDLTIDFYWHRYVDTSLIEYRYYKINHDFHRSP